MPSVGSLAKATHAIRRATCAISASMTVHSALDAGVASALANLEALVLSQEDGTFPGV